MGTASEGEPDRFPTTCLVALSTYFVTAAWERVLWPRGSRRAREAFIQQVHIPGASAEVRVPCPCSQRHRVGRPAGLPLPARLAAPSAGSPGRGHCSVTLVALGCPLSSVGAVSW